MLNSKRRNNSLSKEKVYVLYKNNPAAARVMDVEKRGKNIYLLLRWENYGNEQFKPEKWVRETLCVEFTPESPKKLSRKTPWRFILRWWQNLFNNL
jgi:hypothetical protein